MKLIKKGINPNDKVYIGTCINCGSVMEATTTELSPRQDRNSTTYNGDCLLCMKTVCFIEKPVDDRTEPYG